MYRDAIDLEYDKYSRVWNKPRHLMPPPLPQSQENIPWRALRGILYVFLAGIVIGWAFGYTHGPLGPTVYKTNCTVLYKTK